MSDILENFGLDIEERIKTDLGLTLTDMHPEVADIKNLAGDSTGYIRVYAGEGILKACCMSVNVMPGARYFNIHVHPDASLQAPRFGYEGMLTAQGGQVSMDLYPDTDILMHAKEYLDMYGELQAVWDAAKKSELNPQPSRLPHMRAFCSPYFLNFVGPSVEQLSQIQAIGNQYFDIWLKLFKNAPQLDAAAKAERQERRDVFARRIIELDPDRQMIVQVYGEEVTQSIEEAVMYA